MAILRYTVALLLVGASLGVGLAVKHWTGRGIVSPFFPAIIASVWFLGRGPGAVAVLASLVTADYFLAEPQGFKIGSNDLPRFVFFSLTAVLVAWFAASRRRAEVKLREVVELLEAEVDERTAELDKQRADRRVMEDSTKRIAAELEIRKLAEAKKQTEILDLKRNVESLTAREREIFDLVVSGLLNKQIASKLGIAEITVKVHRKNVMRKMGSRSLADLARKAERLGTPGN